MYVFCIFTKTYAMEITTFTDFRKNMKAYFEKVLRMGQPLFISRPRGNDVVLLSKSEYNSMMETFHLLKSPKNAERLLKAVEADKKGGGQSRQLID